MSEAKKVSIDVDDIFGDLFDLNIRGIRSIAVLWRRPSAYAEAAQDPDWEDRYTPSIRLWLSIAAVGSFLQFLWISDDAPIARVYADGIAGAGLTAPEGMSLLALGREAAVWSYGLMPIIQTILLILLAILWRGWGRPISAGLRVRYLLGVVVPSGSLMLAAVPLLAFIPEEFLTPFGLILAVVAATVDVQTSARGFITAGTLGAKMVRAFALAAMLLVLNVGVSILVQVAGVIIVAYKYGLTPS